MPNPPKKPITIAIPPSKPQPNVPFVEEEKTPVDMPITAVLERRTKLTQTNVADTLSAVHEMRGEIVQYVENDKREHETLRAELATISKRYETLDRKVESLDKKVDDIAVSSATANGKLDILVNSVERQAEITAHREKLTIEREVTEQKLKLEDVADEKKFRRQKWLKIFGIIASIATVFTTAMAAMFGKC